MVHDGTDFLEGVFPQPGVYLRRDIGGEVAQGAAGKEIPQIYRQQHLHRFAPPALGHLFRLQIQNGLHHGGAQQFRHGDAVGMGAVQQRCRRHHHGHQILEAVFFRRAGQVIGGGLPAACLHIPGVAQEAVFQFLGRRFLQPAQHPLLRRDGQAVFPAEVLGQQRFQEDKAAGAVGNGMEKLHGNAVFIDDDPQSAFAHLIEWGMSQRAAFFLLNLRRFGGLLQIIPERAPPQPHGNRGKAPGRDIQRRLQHRPVHRLRQRGRQAEEIVPAPALGGRIDFCRVIQPHPSQASGRREHPVEKVVYGLKILRHILAETVEHIGVPPFRRHDHPALAPGGTQLVVQHPGVIQHYLVPAHKQQRRRQALQITEQRGAERVFRLLRIAARVKLQQFPGDGRVYLPVGFKGFAGGGQVRPRRNADQAAGQGALQLLELQTQCIDQPAAGTFAAQQNLARLIALAQQVGIAFQRILQRGGVGMFRGQAIGGAEHPRPRFRGKRCAEALGIFQTAAGIAAAMEIENHPRAALILGRDPRTLKGREGVLLDIYLPFVQGSHQFPQLILPLAGNFKGAVCHKGLEKIQL